MKRVVRFSALFVLLAALTGCGNTLVCTKGDESIELSFSGDKVSKYVATYSFESEDQAKTYSEYMKEDGVSIKVSGKKVILTTTDEKLLSEEFGNKTKSELKESAEKAGAKCK